MLLVQVDYPSLYICSLKLLTPHHHRVVKLDYYISGNGGSRHINGIRVVKHDVESQKLRHDGGEMITNPDSKRKISLLVASSMTVSLVTVSLMKVS